MRPYIHLLTQIKLDSKKIRRFQLIQLNQKANYNSVKNNQMYRSINKWIELLKIRSVNFIDK